MKKISIVFITLLAFGIFTFFYLHGQKRKPEELRPRKDIESVSDDALNIEAADLTLKEMIFNQLHYYVSSKDSVELLLKHMDSSALSVEKRLKKVGPVDGIDEVVHYYIHQNLSDKRALGKEKLPMTYDELKRLVIEYECFKLEKYVTSGVAPKRYFGYFDRKYDTAPYEKKMYTVIPAIVDVINQYQKEIGDPLRVTDIEIAVTFISEGGAILLRERQDLLKSLHPVLDVGLDDIASGSSELLTLQQRIDSAAGTDLCGLVGWTKNANSVETVVPNDTRWLQHKNGKKGPHAYLTRYMTFEEAIAGTALMYLWEKRIAQKKMKTLSGIKPLHTYSLNNQFIISSLVYNSGILHTPERWKMIEDATTGEWIYKTSERNAKRRWALNVYAPKKALQNLLDGYDYPKQSTEWLAVYHIRQRYGAFVALQRFSDFFTSDGAFSSED